ncbi:MAG: tetratricopeptide repeat protein, partial [Myxococcota bacterium]
MAFNLANLAALEQRRGRPDEADPLYVTALPVLRRRLGAKHPFVATAMRNLALLRASQGRVPDARRLLARADGGRGEARGVAVGAPGPREWIAHEAGPTGVEVDVADRPAEVVGVGEGVGRRGGGPDAAALAAVGVAPPRVGARDAAEAGAGARRGDDVHVVGHEAEGRGVGEDGGDEVEERAGLRVRAEEERVGERVRDEVVHARPCSKRRANGRTLVFGRSPDGRPSPPTDVRRGCGSSLPTATVRPFSCSCS